MKRKILLIVPGGIGNSDPQLDIPVLTKFIEAISPYYSVWVFSLVKVSRVEAFAGGHRILIRSARGSVRDKLVPRLPSIVGGLWRVLREERFDLVHTLWGFPPGALGVLLGRVFEIPSVVTLMGGETADLPGIGYGNRLRRRTRVPTEWACQQCGALVVLTRFQSDQLARFTDSPYSVPVIPFGTWFRKPWEERRDLHTPLRLLFVGQINEVKNIATLLAAIVRLKSQLPVRLRLVGPDQMNGRVHREAAELGVAGDVEWVGAVSHDQVASHYEWADFYVHASLHEGQAIVINEAAAHSLPIVASRVGLAYDLDRSAVTTFEPGDAGELAARILELANNVDRRRSRAITAYAYASRFNMDWTRDAYRSVYERLIREYSG